MIMNAWYNFPIASMISAITPSWSFARFDKFHFGVVWSSNHLSRNRQLRLPSKSGALGGITKEEPPVPSL